MGPILVLCEEFEMPLANHGGGGASTPLTTGPMALHIYSAESNALSRISPVVRFVFGGIFEKHPRLRLIQTEQVGAWYAQVLDELDSRWVAFRHQIGDLVPKLPSEHCRECYFVGASFQSRHEAETAISKELADPLEERPSHWGLASHDWSWPDIGCTNSGQRIQQHRRRMVGIVGARNH